MRRRLKFYKTKTVPTVVGTAVSRVSQTNARIVEYKRQKLDYLEQ